MASAPAVPLARYPSNMDHQSSDTTTANHSAEAPETLYSPTAGTHRTYHIDFSWGKFKSLITDKGDPTSTPLYIVNYKAFSPHLVFKSASSDTAFGTGTIHPISINAECTVHDRPIKLKALKRFKTSYEHQSLAFSDTAELVPMTWTGSVGLKTWEFVCLDEAQMPVAKCVINMWGIKRVGWIEFLGKRAAESEKARDEIIVTGMTLMYCMALRSNNILSLFGAVFAKTGKEGNDATKPHAE
ncbi:uncharacterized protein BDZ99DRAFT_467653 [Mytilinidion resinicola]|uniref:Uncharacterized protein n=1 Tax=Mytilinidion resinicola TaxID=574789 RepID=A0A6A6Y5W7_9PEZI|nr:uncharacterized protein BDZ99DRAFT_467653 [Mytilinidion resinicola]KAF2803918.1 hypothetical protein BDZ99DRAFT_467653 [Mytilinidion resinicola]